ncbi:NAD-dependent succinate-semialdehyde dehydrogenase [Flavihumibacter stibioxidans]|uniref:Succinate-semialdehyde dehydrogenase n=1 Tax=Flavihumibacter stibioxidans TaxID=1834163 RepID=A0ABR7M9Z2_9BACT|nr:NAD-dependent succinate-semialdehyde dehydrogenase [Flavihumibacter stibioxidans]MBC6491868.1 succinate-semialdehyde dehydrogenase [Flavihumibacter stibioxidans]
MGVFRSVYPYTQETIAEYPEMDDASIDLKLITAGEAFSNWRNFSFALRSEVLLSVASILRSEKDKFARLITMEMGKVLPEALAEVEKSAWVCEYYASHARNFLADEVIEAGFTRSIMVHQPVGAVFAIMPWNFPFWQVFRFAAPTLMAGNVALLKHAPTVFGCALAIEDIFRQAGAPAGVFQSLVIAAERSEKIIAADIVQGVTLTGSERAGVAVASLAGKHLKKSLLELGGSDALIVLPDADMKKAARVALQSRLLNAGQSCIASKRLIVIKDAMNDFLPHLLEGIQDFRQGNPFEPGIRVGPMARPDLAEQIQQQIRNAIARGAQLEYGGSVDGCNLQPSLLLGVEPGMAAFDEETFGPLVAVITARTEAAAIKLANNSRYGLAGSIWTKNTDKGMALARQLNTGAVFINSLVKSDPRLPFGGVKKSGYGRELGKPGIKEFVNMKTIVVD